MRFHRAGRFRHIADRASVYSLQNIGVLPIRERHVLGPAFLVGQNFRAVYSYNPSTSYTLALLHLGDRVRGDPPFRQQFPGGERAPTLEEVKEIQRRLIEHGFKPDGIDGRTGADTIKAIVAFQKKVGMDPADGYAGLKVLARLRQGA